MAEDVGGKVVWFVAGAAIGAAVALLYAPASGEETRKKIADTTGAGRDALAQSGKEMIDRGREMYERGRKIADEAADMFDRGKKLVEGAAGNLVGD